MKRILLSTGLALILVGATAALAQDRSDKVLGSVQRGNTTIVFEAANSSDLPMNEYAAWEEFSRDHRAISNQIVIHPGWLKNDAWIGRHRALAEFFAKHPGVREAMVTNPGNFVAPRTAKR